MEVKVNGVVYESRGEIYPSLCSGCAAISMDKLCRDIRHKANTACGGVGVIWIKKGTTAPTNDLNQNPGPSTKEDKETLVEPSKGVKKHSHYFKDVSNLEVIDVYRVLDLFGVTNPCLQHAIKKLLVAGNRGVKDYNKDVQEAIDTLERYKVMQQENEKE